MASKVYDVFLRILTNCKGALEDDRTGDINGLGMELRDNARQFFNELNTILHNMENNLEDLKRTSEKPNATENSVKNAERQCANMMAMLLNGIDNMAEQHFENPEISKETKATVYSYVSALRDEFRKAVDELPAETTERLQTEIENEKRRVYEDVEPTREQVLRWYASMQQALQENGIDLSRPEDRLRIQVAEYKEDAEVPGDYASNNGYIRYALMRRTEDPATGIRLNYENPEPQVSAEDQKKLDQKCEKRDLAAGSIKACTQNLENAIREKKDTSEEIRALEEARSNFVAAHREVSSHCDRMWAKKDQWLLTNTEKFDAGKPEDFEQIYHLFQAAKDGRLFVAVAEGDPSLRQAIVVTKDGGSGLARPAQRDALIPRAIFTDKLPNDIDETYPGLKDEIDSEPEIYHMQEVPKRPAEVEPAPKPGAWSRFKYIISFGLAHGDYDRYDAYQRNRTELRQYDATIGQVTAEVKAHNELAVRRCEELVSRYRPADFPEGTLNAGRVVDGQQLADASYGRGGMYDPEEGLQENVLSLVYYPYLAQHKLDLMKEAKNHPASFAPDGSRTEEGLAYQKEQALQIDDYQKTIQNADTALVKADMHQERYKGADKKTQDAKNLKAFLDAKKTRDYSQIKGWAEQSLDNVFGKIGALYGKQGKEAVSYGCDIFCIIITQNQTVDVNGNPKAPEQIKTSEECMADLHMLFRCIQDAPDPKSPDFAQWYDAAHLADWKAAQAGGRPSLHAVADSLSAILTEVCDENAFPNDVVLPDGKGAVHGVDLTWLSPEQAQCAVLLDRCNHNPGTHPEEYRDSDVSMMIERQMAAKVAKEAGPIQRGAELHKAAQQEKAAKTDSLPAVEARDLDLKQHGMNILP